MYTARFWFLRIGKWSCSIITSWLSASLTSTMHIATPVKRAGALVRASFTSASAEELCRICNFDVPNATALAYAVPLCAAAFVAWAVSVSPIVDTFESWMPTHLQTHCEPGLPCFRISAVHWIMSVVVFYHFTLMIFTAGFRPRSFRSTIQYGWWGIKMVTIILVISAMLYFPSVNVIVSGLSSLEFHELYFMVSFAELLEYAKSLAEVSINRYEHKDPSTELALVLGFTLVPYFFGCIFLIFLFFNVVQPGCDWELGYLFTTGVLVVGYTLFHGIAVGRGAKPRIFLIMLGLPIACGVFIVGHTVLMHSDNCSPYATRALPTPWLTITGMTFFVAMIASLVASSSSVPPNGYELLDQESGTKRHTHDIYRKSWEYHQKFMGAAAFVAMLLTNWCVLANWQRSTKRL